MLTVTDCHEPPLLANSVGLHLSALVCCIAWCYVRNRGLEWSCVYDVMHGAMFRDRVVDRELLCVLLVVILSLHPRLLTSVRARRRRIHHSWCQKRDPCCQRLRQHPRYGRGRFCGGVNADFMTTRSGRSYKTMETSGDGAVTDLVKMLLEDRRRRDEEAAEERTRREAESRQQLELLTRALEGVGTLREPSGEDGARVARRDAEVGLKLTKLGESDDIEAFLTTFERMMVAYGVDKAQWVYRLAPQLTGKAQQAYAAMPTEEAGRYDDVKAAVLRRYNINAETYRQRFREARLKEGETNRELATRLLDLANKWMKECTSVKDVVEVIVKEQLLETMSGGVRVWVQERKPQDSTEAGQLADDYSQARKVTGLGQPGSTRKGEKPAEPRRCYSCKQVGHIEQDCPMKRDASRTGAASGGPSQQQTKKTQPLRCYNCGGVGHRARQCPGNALFCQGRGWMKKQGLTLHGKVEGQVADDILLDTGCSKTLVRRELVPREKILKEQVPIRCAHGDTVMYPLATIEMQLGGVAFTVEAAVSDRLPMSVLLGTDVPQLVELLNGVGQETEANGANGQARDVLVMTRSQQEAQRRVEEEQLGSQQRSGVRPSPVDEVGEAPDPMGDAEESSPELGSAMIGSEFDDDLFTSGKVRQRMTRSQKRANKRNRGGGSCQSEGFDEINLTRAEVEKLQAEDPTLVAERVASEGGANTAGPRFFKRDGLIYRLWTPPGRGGEDFAVEQLVLPLQCRKPVLEVAHKIPMAGHMGKTKTARRILQRFYWPTLYKDVADYCRSCSECQKAAPRSMIRAPLVPLPVMEAPFERIAMDIVGPLPKSRVGNRFVLVICDYATRYPEAVPLRSCDTEHVAEGLVNFFARVGVPGEILSDQGTNFTSQLMKEIENLLHIKAIKTTPYHPQTDGLVERFNKTLKSMLRKYATESGKDWDKLLPYLLFAYREVPQASTGFSPFELLYGRPVRGPLDILKEEWEAGEKSDESVVSYVLSLRDRLERMTEHVQENLGKAQRQQKAWYDKNARNRSFETGDQALILLPVPTNKLMAQWQGPYSILRQVGPVTYEVDMFDRRKRRRILHVNMLRKWHPPAESAYWAEDVTDELDNEIPTWDGGPTYTEGGPVMGDQLDPTQKGELQQLLEGYPEVVRDRPGRTTLAEHHIHTGTSPPVRLAPYRLAHAHRGIIEEELKEMQECGIIEPSSSEWASPMVLVKKKDGTLRLCVDYRRVNAISATDAYPLPRIDDIIDQIGGAKYLTTIDLTKGYWQVPVASSDRGKTAFCTPFGLFQFNVMPFGLQGAPGTFQRMMDGLIRGLSSFSAAYLDDLVVFSSTWEEHVGHVRAIFERLREAGLTAKLRKCQFGMTNCVYLGHVVGGGFLRPEQSKVDAVRSMPAPQTKTQLRAFLGLSGYYRKFIQNYSTMALPLTDLTKKDRPNRLEWTSECDTAFNQLKDQLCSSPVLRSPDFDRGFVLQTDASGRGVGAVLSQLDDAGQDRPVAYFSRKLLPREEKYSTVEKECLAVKLAIQHFRVYLLGRHFVVQTDHRCLEWLDRIKENNARLTRWSLVLQPYDFKVVYRSGKANDNADGLSRAFPDESTHYGVDKKGGGV